MKTLFLVGFLLVCTASGYRLGERRENIQRDMEVQLGRRQIVLLLKKAFPLNKPIQQNQVSI